MITKDGVRGRCQVAWDHESCCLVEQPTSPVVGFFQCSSFRMFLLGAKLSTEIFLSPEQTDIVIKTGKNTIKQFHIKNLSFSGTVWWAQDGVLAKQLLSFAQPISLTT